jgi:hypothetical protein
MLTVFPGRAVRRRLASDFDEVPLGVEARDVQASQGGDAPASRQGIDLHLGRFAFHGQ